MVIPHPHWQRLPASSSVFFAPFSICSQPWGSFHRSPIPSCSPVNICTLLLRSESGSARSRFTETLFIQLTSWDESPLFIVLSGTAEQRKVKKNHSHLFFFFFFYLKRRVFRKYIFFKYVNFVWMNWMNHFELCGLTALIRSAARDQSLSTSDIVIGTKRCPDGN